MKIFRVLTDYQIQYAIESLRKDQHVSYNVPSVSIAGNVVGVTKSAEQPKEGSPGILYTVTLVDRNKVYTLKFSVLLGDEKQLAKFPVGNSVVFSGRLMLSIPPKGSAGPVPIPVFEPEVEVPVGDQQYEIGSFWISKDSKYGELEHRYTGALQLAMNIATKIASMTDTPVDPRIVKEIATSMFIEGNKRGFNN